MTSCPKCGFDLAPDSVECPSCGVVLAKYRALHPPTPVAAEAIVAAEPAARIEAPLPPTLPPLPRSDAQGAPQISPATIAALQSARPWMRFLAGYGFVMLSLAALGGLASLITSVFNPKILPIAVVYGFYSFIGFTIVIPLHRAADALTRLSRDPSAAIESFATHQKEFWRRSGVATAILVVIAVVSLLLALALGVLSTLHK